MVFSDVPANYPAWAAHNAAKQVIQFTHFSKAGGSSMCQLARLNNCTTITKPPGGRNCWDVDLQDSPRWLSPGTPANAGWLRSFHCSHVLAGTWVSHKADGACTNVGIHERSHMADSCAGRLEHATTRAHAGGVRGRSMSAGFIANERFLPGSKGSVCADHFFNLVVLREPVARILSTWNFMQQYRRSDAGGRWPGSVQQRIALSPVVADNFYTRLLLGQYGWSLPLNGVNESHHIEALRRLSEFDLILIIESVAECGAAVQLALGWSVSILPQINVADRRNEIDDDLIQADKTALRKQNVWDLALYKSAQAIASASCAAFDRVAEDQSEAVREAIIAYHSARRAACDSYIHPLFRAGRTQ